MVSSLVLQITFDKQDQWESIILATEPFQAQIREQTFMYLH